MQDWTPPTLPGIPAWDQLLQTGLEQEILPAWLVTCRWFGGKGREMRALRIVRNIPMEAGAARVLAVEVTYAGEKSDTWLVPLALADAGVAQIEGLPVLARWDDGTALCDALWLPGFRSELLDMILKGGQRGDGSAQLAGLRGEAAFTGASLPSRLLAGEQSNTTIIYGDRWFLKFLRQFETGPHPDLEVTRFLSAEAAFAHSAPYAGALELRAAPDLSGLAALLVAYTPNAGDGWACALDAAGSFFERVLTTTGQDRDLAGLMGAIFPARMEQLGRRTAELHVALASRPQTPDFAPEPFTPSWQSALHGELLDSAERLLGQFPLPGGRSAILQAYAPLLDRPFDAVKTRVHGDYHLGQVLNTGEDFVLIDFGGEPRKTLAERNLKRCPLVDVAGMLRSFDYAAAVSLRESQADMAAAEWWVKTISESFLQGYLAMARPAGLVPANEEDSALLLRIFLLDKAIYEVGYELSYRPAFVEIPLRAVEKLLTP